MPAIHSLSMPAPALQEQARSLALIALIQDKIGRSGGAISFAEYMEHALYEPELGYYTNGHMPFGCGGDFVTAPEISPLFSGCLARQCRQILNKLGSVPPPPLEEQNVPVPFEKGEQRFIPSFEKGEQCPVPPLEKGEQCLVPPLEKGEQCLVPPFEKGEQCLVPPFEKGGLGGILELGAGSGKMAADMLLAFEEQGEVPPYTILERSKPLREAQHALITHKAPHLLSYVQWLETWPKTWTGVVIANEWLDALPVHRFVIRKGNFKEQAVGWRDEKFCFVETTPLSGPFEKAAQSFPSLLRLREEDGFCSELSLAIPPVIKKMATFLKQGVVLLIDYGYSEPEYYHSSRSSGTLQCHYKHFAHSDPFLYPGLQDITAHVNFTLVATTALEAGLDRMGFVQQAPFLISCGLPKLFDRLYAKATPKERVKLSQQVKWLTLPDEMGERFWVMGLSKNYAGRFSSRYTPPFSSKFAFC